MSTGDDHTCAIRSSGSLYCWGYNADGRLGTNGGDNASTPVRVEPLFSWLSVSAGGQHTCAINSIGNLYCWGADNWGQLGDDDWNGNQYQPTPVNGGGTWAQVSAGTMHTCAIRLVSGERQKYCWGAAGFLGNGTDTGSRIPVRSGTSTNTLRISVGYQDSCDIRSAGRYIYCTGPNSAGQLGDGTNTDTNTYVREYRHYSWNSLDGGLAHVCAIRSSTLNLYCWGDNGSGQLGDNTHTDRNKPVRVQ